MHDRAREGSGPLVREFYESDDYARLLEGAVKIGTKELVVVLLGGDDTDGHFGHRSPGDYGPLPCWAASIAPDTLEQDDTNSFWVTATFSSP